MASTIDRIAALTAQGLPRNLIASLVGVTPSYISQLHADPDFKALCIDLSAQAVEADVSIDQARHAEAELQTDKLSALFSATLDKAIESLPYLTAAESFRALDTIGKQIALREKSTLTKRAAAGDNGAMGALAAANGATIVKINIPAICAPDIVYSDKNEIISIGGRSTATMPMAQLQSMLNEVEGVSHDLIEAS